MLEASGYHQTTLHAHPDLVIVNTCCITHTASSKSRQGISKARKLCPNATIIVCGCLPVIQNQESDFDETKNIIVVKNKDSLYYTLERLCKVHENSVLNATKINFTHINIKAKKATKIKHKNNLSKLPQLSSFKGHTRAFLKVQDGCDRYCSYCIIPRTRPTITSKPIQTALDEANRLVQSGHKEIVITGIFLGAYGQTTTKRVTWSKQNKLLELLDKLSQIKGLERIRLSSLEPGDVTEELLDLFNERPTMMPHLHLSVQSGSNAVLKRMCRAYSAEHFLETAEKVKSKLDRPAITTDLIAGFPGETDTDFEKTFSLARKIGFSKMHIFKFSPRKGTAAEKMPHQISSRIKDQRSRRLRQLDLELGFEFRRQFINETANILIENSNGRLKGRSERYFLVELEKTGRSVQKNSIIEVALKNNNEHSMTGRPL